MAIIGDIMMKFKGGDEMQVEIRGESVIISGYV